ncbi:MAG: AAA family ATPase [Victivallales bacterium]|nr:AAA family ATPase [Victivallales bacterium]
MRENELIRPEELEPVTQNAVKILKELDKILLGHQELHRMVLIGILSRGHILLEGLPGVGKTALIKALGQLLQLDFNRVQFTPDLMPGDILGANILQECGDGSREMVFHPGPVFTNILLADEINRASPKTQSAMLEAMQEAAVTLLGITRELPSPFFVLASQNPIELEGTYPIPEAQLDRFMFKLEVRTVDSAAMAEIISSRRRGQPPIPDWRLSKTELQEIFAVMERIFLPRAVSSYIARLVEASHPGSRTALPEVNDYVSYGASPRAAIAMAEAARAAALLRGRPAVGFGDVRDVAAAVLNHRLILNYKARMDQMDSRRIIAVLLDKIDAAGLELPEEISLQQ